MHLGQLRQVLLRNTFLLSGFEEPCCAMSRPTGREAFFFFLFSFKKCLFMKVYIVNGKPCTLVGSEDLKLMQVRPELEAAFLKEYEGRIIASGSSIQDVLIKYNLLINDQDQ
jgi:hypothetical protein